MYVKAVDYSGEKTIEKLQEFVNDVISRKLMAVSAVVLIQFNIF